MTKKLARMKDTTNMIRLVQKEKDTMYGYQPPLSRGQLKKTSVILFTKSESTYNGNEAKY